MIQEIWLSNALEWTAVALNLGFTVGIAWGKRWSWLLGLVGALISIFLYANTHTWAMTVLNAFYAVMAVYGWVSWGRKNDSGMIMRWSWKLHAVVITSCLVIARGLAWVLQDHLNGTLPEMDAFITVFGFVATWMMAHRVLENWVYWTIGDLVAVYFNWKIGYDGFALLNVLYIMLAVVGLIKWTRTWRAQQAMAPA